MPTSKRVMVERLQGRFVEVVTAYIDVHQIDQKKLAGKLEMDAAALSRLLKYDPARGRYKHPLSTHYLAPFIESGVVRVSEIYDGQPQADSEKRFWMIMMLLEHYDFLTELDVLIAREGSQGVEKVTSFVKGLNQS